MSKITLVSRVIFAAALVAGLPALPLALLTGLGVFWLITGASAISWLMLADAGVTVARSSKREKEEQEAFKRDLLAVMSGQTPTGPLAKLDGLKGAPSGFPFGS